MKLLLVGKANVGKTSLFKSLKSSKKATLSSLFLSGALSPASMFGSSSPAASVQVQLSTDGIDMEDWSPTSEGPAVSFNVFDFAGQVNK